MISQLTGVVVEASGTWIVLDLHGFGLKALCTPATAAKARLGEALTLHTSLVVREDSLTLYGFAQAAERDCFELAQSASGVGPRTAQALVSVLGPEGFAAAVANADVKALTRVPGIGTKGAQRIVIELKDKVGAIGAGELDLGGELWREQVKTGLEGLGYSSRDADGAVERLRPLVEAEPDIPIATLIRSALKALAR
ncbi:MAG: Holliday junction branch migration protein RuvA [Propionibacteriaceae bacterium]|nr:Holliday junction branch migration protein RuvA [Propionibacteriaceae bacterium]